MAYLQIEGNIGQLLQMSANVIGEAKGLPPLCPIQHDIELFLDSTLLYMDL